jgi:adenosylcobinamide-GDP ribazoletransferase
VTEQTAPARGSPLPAPLRGVRAAFVFLTRLPVGGFPYQRADFHWAAAHFPLVGALVGGAGAAVFLLAFPLGATVAALLSLGTTAFLTGAFHEDGLADTFDALGGSHNQARLFEILKDSRIGTFGAVALLVVLALKVACLSATQPLAGAVALVLSHAFARVGPVWLLVTHEYVSPDAAAKGKGVAGAGLPQALVASAWALGFVALAGASGAGAPLKLLAALAAPLVSSALLGVWFRRRAGGVTGDFLGATEQLGEVAAWLVFVAHT